MMMNTVRMQKIVWAVVLIVILIGGYFLLQKNGTGQSQKESAVGSYSYSCANGSTFTMMPSEDVSTIKISGDSQGMFTGEATLAAKEGEGARFEGSAGGNAVVFVGAGEEVSLQVGSATTTCNPVANAENAPWNWGDAGEGGGSSQPEVTLVVSESIVGKWQSTTDAKFVREFKDGGKVTDWYDNETKSEGTFKVFAKSNPIEVNFPMAENKVYLQLTMQGSEAEKLNFSVDKLTPEALQLTYMDRGGVLTFKAVK